MGERGKERDMILPASPEKKKKEKKTAKHKRETESKKETVLFTRVLQSLANNHNPQCCQRQPHAYYRYPLAHPCVCGSASASCAFDVLC